MHEKVLSTCTLEKAFKEREKKKHSTSKQERVRWMCLQEYECTSVSSEGASVSQWSDSSCQCEAYSEQILFQCHCWGVPPYCIRPWVNFKCCFFTSQFSYNHWVVLFILCANNASAFADRWGELAWTFISCLLGCNRWSGLTFPRKLINVMSSSLIEREREPPPDRSFFSFMASESTLSYGHDNSESFFPSVQQKQLDHCK